MRGAIEGRPLTHTVAGRTNGVMSMLGRYRIMAARCTGVTRLIVRAE